jgi:hypothetical protein
LCQKASGPDLLIERAELNGFHDELTGDRFRSGQVGDGAGKNMMKTLLTTLAVYLVSLAACTTLEAQERFHARGPSAPVKMEPHQQGVVEVHFDLLPTSMRCNAPAYPCMVTENDIQYSNGFAETYDPRLDANAAETSFEPAFDDSNEYSRMWVESQNDARIVVRVRGALVSDEGKRIAHADIPSGSPHGQGDWVDEHWNNAKEMQYSRNLGKPEGLELIRISAN